MTHQSQDPMREALLPFVKTLEHDVSKDEYDTDIFRPMSSGYNRAPLITVGDLRRLVAALASTSPQAVQEPVASKLGRWMAAALDDDAVCEEMKADIRAWFEAGEPAQAVCPPAPQAPDRMRDRPYCDPVKQGEAFYMTLYAKDGASWSANEHQKLWIEAARDYERRRTALTEAGDAK